MVQLFAFQSGQSKKYDASLLLTELGTTVQRVHNSPAANE